LKAGGKTKQFLDQCPKVRRPLLREKNARKMLLEEVRIQILEKAEEFYFLFFLKFVSK